MCKDWPTPSRLPVQKHLLKWHPLEKINLQVSLLLQQSHRLTWALWGSWQRVQRLQSAKTARRMSGKHTRGKADIANSCEVTAIHPNLWQPPTKDSWSLRIPATDSKPHWGSAFEGALSSLLPPDLQGLNSTLHHPQNLEPPSDFWVFHSPQTPTAHQSSSGNTTVKESIPVALFQPFHHPAQPGPSPLWPAVWPGCVTPPLHNKTRSKHRENSHPALQIPFRFIDKRSSASAERQKSQRQHKILQERSTATRFQLVQIQFLTNFRADSHFHQICLYIPCVPDKWCH